MKRYTNGPVIMNPSLPTRAECMNEENVSSPSYRLTTKDRCDVEVGAVISGANGSGPVSKSLV